mmetsp:Transcript_47701/g.104049  ORF Transcript_47701/g.104049 Transcript_47701/m.104049 type:complete len:210 (-) Transcript_47701:1023-1652(-)
MFWTKQFQTGTSCSGTICAGALDSSGSASNQNTPDTGAIALLRKAPLSGLHQELLERQNMIQKPGTAGLAGIRKIAMAGKNGTRLAVSMSMRRMRPRPCTRPKPPLPPMMPLIRPRKQRPFSVPPARPMQMARNAICQTKQLLKPDGGRSCIHLHLRPDRSIGPTWATGTMKPLLLASRWIYHIIDQRENPVDLDNISMVVCHMPLRVI